MNSNCSVTEAAQAVLDEIFWFAEYKEKHPSRFFYYFEHAISREMLVNLAGFLKLDPNEAWLSNALSVMKIQSSYEHDSELLTFYRKRVADKSSRFPALSEGLWSFI